MTRTTAFTSTLTTLTCFIMLLATPVSAQECGEYEVTAVIVGPQCGGFGLTAVVPIAINENGDVVGLIACLGAGDQAFLWTAEAGLQILEMPVGSSQSRAIDINDNPEGQIVGTVDIIEIGGTRAFFIDGDNLILIHPPNEGTFSSVAALNNQSQIVGLTSDGTPYSKAYIWEDEAMTIIEPTFGARSAARAINEAGVVVGWMGTGIGIDSHAFVWNDGKQQDLGPIPDGLSGSATAINSRNQITIDGSYRNDHPLGFFSGGFLWEAGIWTDIGMLQGYDALAIMGLNIYSTIVGWSRAIKNGQLPDVGFVWQNGVMTNLNDLINHGAGLAIDRAVAINNLGQILGKAHSQELDATVAVILTPIAGPLADLNGDCKVSETDLLILLESWGLCDNCVNCPADLNTDCVVSTIDLLILLSNWG